MYTIWISAPLHCPFFHVLALVSTIINMDLQVSFGQAGLSFGMKSSAEKDKETNDGELGTPHSWKREKASVC